MSQPSSRVVPRAAGALLPGTALALMLLSVACGGSKETCGTGTVEKDGACVPTSSALTCGAGTVLLEGVCVPAGSTDGGSCVPSCGGRACGDDGCGGSCGTCGDPKTPVCEPHLGRCIAQCVPECSGRTCGSDGCGGSCGDCAAGNSCRSNARCVPDGWTCDPTWYGAGDACDCGCGTADTDCSDPAAPLAGCETLQRCNAQGKCVSSVPAGWTCAPEAYASLDACNCGCGVPDPDCAYDRLALLGCGAGVTVCGADGTCGSCTPDCNGKQCGSDGCGGLCGACDDPILSSCRLGTCVDACHPLALRCEYATCGDDGCGGSCGSCVQGTTCRDGRCLRNISTADPASCVGHCGSKAPGGCYCTPTCADTGLCCQDYVAACSCTPDCAGKECGDDHCNGTCGICSDPNRKYCGADQKCTGSCTPQCDGKACGDNGCGGVCGTCGSGESCTYLGQCVPDAWKCDSFLYGDGRGCDCGCGAPDPDCKVADAAVFGCPTSKTKCKADGKCDVTFCEADTSCGAGQWCTGVYFSGDAQFGGACEAPTASANPPGYTCQIGEGCASLVCLDGLCRRYCGHDADCPAAQICVGLEVRDPITGELRGTAPVCNGVGSGRGCTSQAACAAAGERCIAVVDASTHGPRYVCALSVATSASGQSCLSSACPDGYLCATVGGTQQCTLVCPGGNADCPTGWKCGAVPFTLAGTSSAPSIPACVPN